MQLLDLHVDVLLIFVTLLSREDLSALTRTCHVLHDALVHALLISDPVRLSRNMLPSFSEFVRAGTGDRATLLRDLRFDFFPATPRITIGYKIVETFTALMRASHNLVDLSIHSISFGFPPDDLQDALSPLRRLERLTLGHLTADYRDVLAPVAPTLRFVDLSFKDMHGDLPLVNPIPFLRHYRSTIDSCGLAGFTLADCDEPLPGVRRLKASSFALDSDETGWVGPLVHVFPNLERLDLQSLLSQEGSTAIEYLDPQNEDDLLIARDWRRKGQTWQAQHGSWATGLRYLRVRSIMEAFCLGLSCHVSRLDVCENAQSMGITSTEAVLADIRPRCVRFPVSSDDAPGSATDFLQAISNIPSITHLIVDVSDDVSSATGPTDLVARLVMSFPNSAITHFYVHFEDDTHRAPRKRSSSAETLPSVYAQIPDVVWRARRDIQALRWIFVGSNPHGVRGWERYSADEGGIEWKELDDSCVRQVIEAEDMVRYDDPNQIAVHRIPGARRTHATRRAVKGSSLIIW